jgi:FkbM family methyltransferase
MAKIAPNTNPPLTRYLVEHTNVFRDDPIVLVDVGSRGGFNSEWQVFGSCAKIYGFEPEEEECSRLNAGAAPNVTYIPCALASRNGTATLYETKLAASTGLYRTNMEYFGRLLNRDNGITVSEKKIAVRTLANVMSERGVKAIDFIKLDAEGAELDILQGSADFLKEVSPLGILSEIRFHEEINGSPPFAALDQFVRTLGLRLFGLQHYHQSRRALPYPGLADYRLPTGERFFAYTTGGQIQDGDALYFRDMLIAANREAMSGTSAVRLLKLAALYEIYRFNDCAAELILAAREKIGLLVDCDHLLDLLASDTNGTRTSYDEYLAAYFSSHGENRRAIASTIHAARAIPPVRYFAHVYASARRRVAQSWRLLGRALSRGKR